MLFAACDIACIMNLMLFFGGVVLFVILLIVQDYFEGKHISEIHEAFRREMFADFANRKKANQKTKDEITPKRISDDRPVTLLLK